MRKLGDTITFDFTTHNPSTGMAQDADSLPTCKVFEDDNDTAILTPTVVKRAGETGNYRVSVEATVGNGFEVGKTYNAIASATVNSISAKSRIGIFVLDSKRNADMNDLSTSQIRNEIDLEFSERGYSVERSGLLDNLDAKVSTRSLETGGKIDSIKTETDKIQLEIINKKDEFKADVSALALEATIQTIKAKTDHINWADITDIKSKTDTIDWNNVLAIKTKTDTVDWTDIDSIITMSGDIKDKTDTIDWNNVLTIKTKTDTILWTDITAIKTEEDLIKIETDKIQPEIISKKDEYKADVSSLALQATVESLDLELDGVAKESTLNTKASQVSVDLIKIKTDQLTFTELNKVDSKAILSHEEHNKIMSIPDIQLTAYIRNKRYLEKIGTTWYIVVRNDDDSDDILRKALKDKGGNDISDIAIGVMAQEMRSSV